MNGGEGGELIARCSEEVYCCKRGYKILPRARCLVFCVMGGGGILVVDERDGGF